jgi:coenzyme PQQ biosynthesis protein PqqD
MNTRLFPSSDSIPRLAAHIRLRHDQKRGWTIQAPERSFLLDDIAHAVIAACDGRKSLAEIIAGLCQAFPDAPPEVIANDVGTLLQDFVDKGVITA